MAHEFTGGVRCPDHAAERRQQVGSRSTQVSETPVRQRQHPGPDGAPHRIGDHENLHTDLSVIAHQQESSISG